MKRIFSMMLIAASLFTTACDKDDNTVDNKETYVGEMTIAMSYMNMPITTKQANVKYIFEEGDKSADVTLSKVKFTTGLAEKLPMVFEEDPYMPALDILLADIPEVGDDTYEIDEITPKTLFGNTFDTNIIKEVTNVKVTESNDNLKVSFDCSMALSFGNVTATISFDGIEEE